MRRIRVRAGLAGLVFATGSLTGCLAPWTDSAQLPDATNQDPADAIRALAAAGLQVRFRAIASITAADTGINGYAVSGQEPAAGARIAKGGRVTLILVNGANGGGFPPVPADLVSVQSVIGRDPNAAIAQLAQLGLLVDVPGTGERTTLAVVSQEPSAGTTVKQGTHISLAS